ncbi:TonB family protein [Hymenobacter sp. GOD-10R]|uniref:TonB family protein n=1 Tax=Hymenobacter sp. GOD-10R TaxID=3093922 RepID=UPI002D78817C|nr:TonB family protein [Hymenobacter sp. GOD-10R]WRQ28196.1 TonB family protein [Hymenobacter sp. GOD-10R]
MPPLLNWMLLSTIVLGTLWVLYYLALRPERCFRYNRLFLLLAPALAAGLPLLRLPSLWPTAPALLDRLPSFLLPEVHVGAAATPQPEINWLLCGYGAGAVGFLLHLAWQLWQQWRFTRSLPAEQYPGYTLRLTGGHQPTGSFGRTVYWDETTPLDAFEAAQVLQHELAHARQGHTYDRLWLALWRAVLWFNPFVHLLPRALHLTHEYLADAAASQATPSSYAALLARQAATRLGFTPALTTTFHTSSILTRIAMLHHPPVLRRWKQWLALPVGALLLTVVACEQTTEPAAPTAVASSSSRVAPPPPPIVYTTVEQTPQYPGGLGQLAKDIAQRVRYPAAARAMQVEGPVFVSFIVAEDGSIQAVELKKGIARLKGLETVGKEMDEAAVTAVRNLPGKWTPGRQGGKAVAVSFTVPVVFLLNPKYHATLVGTPRPPSQKN